MEEAHLYRAGELAGGLVGWGAPMLSRGQQLSPREGEVEVLLLEGRSTRGIGQVLGISRSTAKAHVSAVLRKRGVRSKVELLVRALGRAMGRRAA